MLDHVGIAVSELGSARQFYVEALAPLGIGIIMEVTEEMTGGHGAHLGLGTPGKPFFWIGTGKQAAGSTHVAFVAADRVAVDAFYKAAMAAGGRDNGAPGLRPEYHPDYYGAFVLDPDGNNIEAVCHQGAGT